MTTKLSVFLLTLLATTLMAGASLAAESATMTNPMSKPEPIFRETDNYPALGYTKEFNEHYGVAPAWTSSLSGKELIIRETDEHPSLGYGNF